MVKRKILVVDDDADILQVVEIILQMHNFIVHTLSKWHKIYSAIEVFLPDVILLDVSLSGADGRDLCYQLKNAEQTKNLPVILFSADAELINNFENCKATDVILKPFDAAGLVDTIRKHIA